MGNHISNAYVPSTTTVTTTVVVHGPAITNGQKRLSRSDSYQEEPLDEEEYPEIIPKEAHRKDSQYSYQSQQSHQSQQSQHSQQQQQQKPKLTRGDSYSSDHYPDDYGRRDSYAQPTGQRKDSYSSNQDFKPQLQRTDSYKRGYGQNFTTPQPISRAESYQRGYFKDQEDTDQAEIPVLSNTVNGDYKMREEALER